MSCDGSMSTSYSLYSHSEKNAHISFSPLGPAEKDIIVDPGMIEYIGLCGNMIRPFEVKISKYPRT